MSTCVTGNLGKNKLGHWESDEIGIHDGLKLHRRNNAIRVRILSFPQNNYNMKELDDIPTEIKESIEYIPVNNYTEVYKIIRGN